MFKQITQKEETIIISILLLVILIFGAFMRLWHLGYSSYWIDEGFTLMQARGISMHGYPLLDSGFVEWKDLLIPYIIAPFVKFFSFEHTWILRLPAAVFGIVSIFIAHHLASNMFSRYVGLIFAFFIATSHWYIAWSQQVRGYSALIFFVLLCFYFLSKHNKENIYKYLVYAFVSIIFAVLAKKFAIILFIPFLVYIFSKKLYKLFYIFVIPSTIISVFFIYMVRHTLVVNPLNYFFIYINQYLLSYFGVFFILAMGGFILASLYDKSNSSLHLSILTFFISSIVVFSLFVFVSEKRYLLMITPFLFLYTAYLIDYIAKIFKQRFMMMIILFLCVVIASILLHSSIVLIPQKHYALEYYTPQPNYKKAYTAILDNGFDENDVIISPNPFMDIIYLGQSDYAIPWSLTGRGDETNLKKDKEFHSGTRKLYGKGSKTGMDKIEKLRENGDVYVILDKLAARRMKFDLWDDITDLGQEIFKDGKEHSISVYLFAQTR